MDKIIQLEVASCSLYLFRKVCLSNSSWVNKSSSEADFLWMLQKVKLSLYTWVFSLLVFWRHWPPRNAYENIGTVLLRDGLAFPDSCAILVCWGKCTYIASINTNGLYGSRGDYKPVGLNGSLPHCQSYTSSPLQINAKVNRLLRKLT